MKKYLNLIFLIALTIIFSAQTAFAETDEISPDVRISFENALKDGIPEYISVQGGTASVTESGTLKLTTYASSGVSYPLFILNVDIDSSDYDYIEVGLKWANETNTVSPVLYFLTETQTDWTIGGYSQRQYVQGETNEAGITPFTFAISQKDGWEGNITGLRLDAAELAGEYELAYINIYSNCLKITYDANGGINPPVKQTNLTPGTYALSTASPTRNNYAFVGWAATSDATEEDIINDITIENYDITVYAVWKEQSTSAIDKDIFSLKAEFDTEGINDGWSDYGRMQVVTEDGVMKITTLAFDARMQNIISDPKSEGMSSEYSLMKIRYRKPTNASQAILRWQTSDSESTGYDIGAAEENVRRLIFDYSQSEASDEWVEQTIDLSRSPKWNGSICCIWFDVLIYTDASSQTPGYIEFDYIKFMRPGNETITYDANIEYARELTGNAALEIQNIPESESGYPLGKGYEVSEKIPYTIDDRLEFGGWSTDKYSTESVGDTLTITGNMTLYAIWILNPVEELSFPTEAIPARTNRDIWKEDKKEYPLDTGFEDIEEIDKIKEKSYNNQLSISEESFSGKFALQVKATDSIYLPLRETLGFYVADTEAATNAIKTNIVHFKAKAKNNTESITFYVCYEIDGESKTTKILGDSDNDGAFELGEDFSQGKWTDFTLDLLNTEQDINFFTAKGIYIKPNIGSHWLFDDIKSSFRIVDQNFWNLSPFAKDNLIYSDNNTLHFREAENKEQSAAVSESEDKNPRYDTKTVYTSSKLLLDERLASLYIDAEYEVVGTPNQFNNPPLLSDLLSEGSINASKSATSGRYIINSNKPVIITYNLNSDNRYMLKYTVSATNGYLNVTAKTEKGFSLKKSVKEKETVEITNIFPPDKSGSITISSNKSYNAEIYNIHLYEYSEISSEKLRQFENSISDDSSIKYHYSCENVTVKHTDLPGISNAEYTGINKGSLTMSALATDYVVIRTVNPMNSTNEAYILLDNKKTYYIDYGVNDYVITGTKFNKITLYNFESNNALLTEIHKYPYFRNTNPDSKSITELTVPSCKKIVYTPSTKYLYYVDESNNVLLYDIDNNQEYTAKIEEDNVLITDNGEILVSQNGRCCCFKSINEGYYKTIFDEESKELTTCSISNAMSEPVFIDNYGNIYFARNGDSDNGSSLEDENGTTLYNFNSDSPPDIYFHKDGGYAIYKSSDSKKLMILKKFGEMYENTASFSVSSIGSATSSTDEIKNIVVGDSNAYFNFKKASYSLDLETASTKSIGVQGDVKSVSDSGKLLVYSSGLRRLYTYNPSDRTTESIGVDADNDKNIYLSDERERFLYINTDGTPEFYSTISNENMVKALLSFDGMGTWYSFENGRWILAYSGLMPDYEAFTAHGMTASKVYDITEADYEKLYQSPDVDILSVSIAFRIMSKSPEASPEIRNIIYKTVSDKNEKYVYSAKSEIYEKSEIANIKSVYPVETGITSDFERYYFLSLGEGWIYTVKNNQIKKISLTATELFGDIKGNWMTIKQLGMTSKELSSLSSELLNSLLINPEYKNESFEIISCLRADSNDSSLYSVEYSLVYDKAYGFDCENVIITMTDDKIIQLDASETDAFLNWFEARQRNVGPVFYSTKTNSVPTYINYFMIKNVEIS